MTNRVIHSIKYGAAVILMVVIITSALIAAFAYEAWGHLVKRFK